jgi:hypothetical protein
MTTTTTTNKDLYISAHAAAIKLADVTDHFELEGQMRSEFTAANHDKADYPRWQIYFNERRGTMMNLATQDAPSTIIARVAAAKEAQKIAAEAAKKLAAKEVAGEAAQ